MQALRIILYVVQVDVPGNVRVNIRASLNSDLRSAYLSETQAEATFIFLLPANFEFESNT